MPPIWLHFGSHPPLDPDIRFLKDSSTLQGISPLFGSYLRENWSHLHESITGSGPHTPWRRSVISCLHCLCTGARRSTARIRGSIGVARCRSGRDWIRAGRLPSQEQTARTRTSRTHFGPNIDYVISSQLLPYHAMLMCPLIEKRTCVGVRWLAAVAPPAMGHWDTCPLVFKHLF